MRNVRTAVAAALALVIPAYAFGQGGTVECCPPGATPSTGRCLERLVRGDDPDAMTAACAGLTASRLFTMGAGRQKNCKGAPGNLLAAPQEEWGEKWGFWQDGPPNFSYERQLYHENRMAIGSPACDRPEWEIAREHCKESGFEAVHVYLALSPDQSEIFAHSASEADPWKKDPRLTANVRYKSLENFDEIGAYLRGLARECKIVRFLYVSSHGSPGQLYVGFQGKKGKKTITDVVRNVIDPCLLAPGAKLQFDGCMVSCGALAEPVRQGLEHVLGDPAYAAPDNATPLDGVEVLLGTGLMRDHIYDKSKYFLFGPTERHIEVSAENGQALIYSVDKNRVSADEPTSAAPACPEAWSKTPQKTLDQIAAGQ